MWEAQSGADGDGFPVLLLSSLAFVHEFSLVTAVFPLVLFTYALVSPGKKPLRFPDTHSHTRTHTLTQTY